MESKIKELGLNIDTIKNIVSEWYRRSDFPDFFQASNGSYLEQIVHDKSNEAYIDDLRSIKSKYNLTDNDILLIVIDWYIEYYLPSKMCDVFGIIQNENEEELDDFCADKIID